MERDYAAFVVGVIIVIRIPADAELHDALFRAVRNQQHKPVPAKQQPESPVRWDVHTYKIGDPVLFNSTTRFPWLYNNLKGRIIDIDTSETQITFTLEVDTIINSIDVEGSV